MEEWYYYINFFTTFPGHPGIEPGIFRLTVGRFSTQLMPIYFNNHTTLNLLSSAGDFMTAAFGWPPCRRRF